jgi:hypothetical protein
MTTVSRTRRRLTAVALVCALALLSCWKVDADLKLSTNTLDFGASQNEKTFTVTNDSKDNALTSGVTLLDYQLKGNRPWVTVSPAAGRCGGDESATHTVTVDRSALPDGDSFATITATSNGGNADITVHVVKGAGGGDCTDVPTAPADPSPADDATDVSVDGDLAWQGGNSQCDGLSATYDVYFGTTTPPPFHHNSGDKKTFNPGRMAANTLIYWRIVARDANGSTSGPTWSFRTESASTGCTEGPSEFNSLAPASDATGVSVNQDLSWSGANSQCSGLTATYDVYFGTASPAPFDHNNGTEKSWDPGTLEGRQTYYWRIVAKDDNGTRSSGERKFTTVCVDDNGASLTAPCHPSPSNGKEKVNTTVSASWECGTTDCTEDVTFTVYLGRSTDLGDSEVVGTTTAHTLKFPTLRGGTNYYWKVVAHAGITSRSSPVWSFKTK